MRRRKASGLINGVKSMGSDSIDFSCPAQRHGDLRSPPVSRGSESNESDPIDLTPLILR